MDFSQHWARRFEVYAIETLILNLIFYVRTLDFKIRSDLCECASGGEGLAPKPANRQTEKRGWGGGRSIYLIICFRRPMISGDSLLSRATVCQMSSNSRHTVGWLYSDWEHLHIGRQALMFVRSSGRAEMTWCFCSNARREKCPKVKVPSFMLGRTVDSEAPAAWPVWATHERG